MSGRDGWNNPELKPFREEIEALLGGEAPLFWAAMDEPALSALRINSLRAGAGGAAQAFSAGKVPWEEMGRYVKAGLKPSAHPAHAAGAYYMQDASAMAPAAVLNARPGERVLDLCAAPGGKAGQSAQRLGGEGLLVANEPDRKRAKALASNLERLGVKNALVVSALPEKLSERWADFFDAVQVDAPCSGEGMFRRDPQAALQWTPGAPKGCALRQAQILHEAGRMTAPGGRLVYSTCTFNRTENEGVVLDFLKGHPEFEPMEFELNGVGRSSGGMLRLWPHKIQGEGHFVAALRKKGAPAPAPQAPDRKRRPNPDLERGVQALIREVLGQMPEWMEGLELSLEGDRLMAAPRGLPPHDGLFVLMKGVCLARVKKGYIEPEHALAMALEMDQAIRRAELSEEQALRALRGEALPWDGEKGWTLLCFMGMPLGWAKGADGLLKNHIPKGLRWN